MQSKTFSWQLAWNYPPFRIKLISGILVMGIILFFLPDYFLFIQGRPGALINDLVLERVPAHDVSIYIFMVLYPMTGFFIWRALGKSSICINALWGYIFLCTARIITIFFIPLEAPINIIHLSDPFSLIFYGANIITKDLFFSGHTATLCLVALCLENKREKIIAFIATAILGVLLLIQHVHYTADVVAAPFFSYLFWYLGKKVAQNNLV